jgi:hypothetical protein
VIFTSSKLLDGTANSGGKDYTGKGEGNDAYMNFVEDLTVDVGAGNPGAVGIDYLANNIGAVRNVTLHAPAGSGAIGLSMMRKWPGPALIQDVAIDGFAVGTATAQTEYGLTFEHVRLQGQGKIGLRNDQNALAIRDLHVSGSPQPIVNAGDKGFLAIAGGDLGKGAARISDAIDNQGTVTLRGKVQDGKGQDGVLRGHDNWTPSPAPGWLPHVEDRPAMPSVPIEKWANVQRFGAVADPKHDSTEALRQAFASGAAVVYFPNGLYAISDSIEIPPTVQRIVGMNSTLTVLPSRRPSFARTSGMLRIASAGSPIAIERLAFDNSNLGAQVGIESSGARDVVVRDAVGAGVTLLSRTKSGGRAFVEDVCCGKIELAGAAPVYARQLDTEGGGTRIVNHGSPFWVLGLKTEGVCTVVDNRDGARTDIFGGLLYMVREPGNSPLPAFRNQDASFSGAFAEESLRPTSRYGTFLADERGGQSNNFDAARFPERGYGRVVPDLSVTDKTAQ